MIRSLRLGLVLVVFFGMTYAQAADVARSRGLDSIGIPLKQNSPQECSKNDVFPSSKSKASQNEMVFRPAKHRTEGCYISVDGAISALKSRGMIVDVRDPQAFEKYRIANSLNMPLHAVRTKGFLRSVPVILVNEGRDTAPLDTACQDLRRAGFNKVAVLDGGLNAWRQKAGTLAGDVVAQKELNKMTPAELFEESVYSDWLIADFSGQGKSVVSKYLPQAVARSYISDEKRFLRDYKELVSQRGKGNVRVIVVTRKGDEYDKVNAWLQRAGQPLPLFLEGGLEGYKQFTHSQVAIWHRVDNPPRRRGCSTS